MTPHYHRRQTIHICLLCFILLIAILAASCGAQKDPCKERRGLSGYGYGWLENRSTKEVFILDSTCKVICTFKDGTNMLHSKQTF